MKPNNFYPPKKNWGSHASHSQRRSVHFDRPLGRCSLHSSQSQQTWCHTVHSAIVSPFVPYDEGRRLLKRLSQLSGKRRTAYMCHNANRLGRGGTHLWASFGKKQRPSQLPCLACVYKRASYCLDSILYKNDGALGGAIRFAACFGIVDFLHNSG